MKSKPSDPSGTASEPEPIALGDCSPETKRLVLIDSERGKKSRGATAQAEIPQGDIEELLARRRLFEEFEEELAVALSKGAKVEPGVHDLQLVPHRSRSGFVLKLVVK